MPYLSDHERLIISITTIYRINPITGCYESPKPNPMENMSEERKEYEAVQLAQLMDKLTR